MTDDTADDTASGATSGAASGFPLLPLDPDLLTPRDLQRARAVLDGRNPWEVLGSDDSMTLTIWCLKSRERPEFTWDNALDTPLGDFAPAGAPGSAQPPPTPGPDTSGSEPAANGTPTGPGSGSGSKRRRSSATSTA